MKKLFLSAVSAALLSGTLFADGIEFKLDKPADWTTNQPVQWVGPKKDVMQVKGSVFVRSAKLFDVNVNKKYKLEADVKAVSGGPVNVYVGFEPYDKKGRAISASYVNAVIGSETTLLQAAKKGDTKLILKNNPKWNVKWIVAVAFNAKKDLSDLPNFDIVNLKSVKTVNGNLEVTLKKPMHKAVKAGTPVRVHQGGGYMYVCGYKKIANGQTQEFKGTAKGQSKLFLTSHQWAPGTAKARIVLLVNWGNPKAVSEVRDVELEIEK